MKRFLCWLFGHGRGQVAYYDDGFGAEHMKKTDCSRCR